MKIEPLLQKNYSKFGDVISVREDITPVPANHGTAQRYNHLGELKNLRANAKPNLCLYRSEAQILRSKPEFEIKGLERHPFSTQVFIPMVRHPFIVIVAQGDEVPDLSTLRVFSSDGTQGMSYHPGVWHHPLVTLEHEIDFSCFIFEEGTAQDCQEFKFEKSLQLDLSSIIS